MIKQNKTMMFEDWCSMYNPIINVFDENASFDDGEGGVMFETYGKELDFVLATADSTPENVWTYLDGMDGSPIVVNGYWLVNRIGYFVTHKPAEPDTQYFIEFEKF
jgi:hypothetical protein